MALHQVVGHRSLVPRIGWSQPCSGWKPEFRRHRMCTKVSTRPPWDHHRMAAGVENRIELQGCPMFVFYNNRIGCLGSILISIALTFLLILVFRLLSG